MVRCANVKSADPRIARDFRFVLEPRLPARAREHLFEAFQSSGRPGGSGLGLAIAAELVRAHGGDIHLVEGTIGATFRISIPDRPVELQSVRNERARA